MEIHIGGKIKTIVELIVKMSPLCYGDGADFTKRNGVSSIYIFYAKKKYIHFLSKRMLQKSKIDSIHMSNYGYLKEKKGKWFSLAKEKDVIIFASVRNTGKSKDFNVVRNMHLHMHISLLRKTDKEKKERKSS